MYLLAIIHFQPKKDFCVKESKIMLELFIIFVISINSYIYYKMKVFLSWSGHKSHQVALVLRDWLPSVIQSIMPYVSSEDIDKGARWSTDIAKELEDSSFGILCVTRENLEAPWLLFEAGALSKMMDKASVCPFIFDLKRAEVKGPILQFQSTIFEKEDVKKLLLSLNKCCNELSLKEDLLIKTFDVWWPKLEESLNKINEEKSSEETRLDDKDLKNEILEEILELARTNQKILRYQDTLLPPEYIEFVFKERIGVSHKERGLLEDLHGTEIELEHRMMQMRDRVEIYFRDGKIIDEDLYMNFRRLFELTKQTSMLRENIKRFPNRRII